MADPMRFTINVRKKKSYEQNTIVTHELRSALGLTAGGISRTCIVNCNESVICV
jgi:hypothetical protein